MTLSITPTVITSDLTHHTARRLERGWKASWLPVDHLLNRDQAEAAMELAEIVAKGRDGGPDTTNYA